jgi:transketolase
MPLLTEDANIKFELGKGRVIKQGEDIAIIATGELVYPALQAAQKLEKEFGINATVVSMHTIKPLDSKLVLDLAEKTQAIITIEEHMVNGGLGEACASLLLQNGYQKPFKIMGIPDEYTVTGSQVEIFNHYGLNADGIAETAKEMLTQSA